MFGKSRMKRNAETNLYAEIDPMIEYLDCYCFVLHKNETIHFFFSSTSGFKKRTVNVKQMLRIRIENNNNK